MEISMCINQTKIRRHAAYGPTSETIAVACRKCWACRKNRVNDLVGRVLCEYAYSDWTIAVTLTYDDARSTVEQTKMLQKIDVRRFLQRLRNHAYRFRYLYAGEYGEQKGRAHWHVLLFGVGKPIEIPIRERFEWRDGRKVFWPYGHTWADDAIDEKTIRYVAKYLVKADDPRFEKYALKGEHVLRYSTKPLMGFRYLVDWAERQAAMRVWPQSFGYLPPFADKRNKYSFYGRAQHVFFDVFFDLWPEAINAPRNETMERAFKRYTRYNAQKYWDGLPASERAKILADEIRPRWAQRELTRSEILWLQYRDGPGYGAEIEERNKWLKNLQGGGQGPQFLPVRNRSDRRPG